MIDWNKPIQTTDGVPVRVIGSYLYTDGLARKVALIPMPTLPGAERILSLTEDGISPCGVHVMNVIEETEIFGNVYYGGENCVPAFHCYHTLAEAKRASCSYADGTIRLVFDKKTAKLKSVSLA